MSKCGTLSGSSRLRVCVACRQCEIGEVFKPDNLYCSTRNADIKIPLDKIVGLDTHEQTMPKKGDVRGANYQGPFFSLDHTMYYLRRLSWFARAAVLQGKRPVRMNHTPPDKEFLLSGMSRA